MVDEQLSTVTVCGRVTERPAMSETERGEPLARFQVQLGENRVWCLCVGHLGANAHRFAAPGVEIVGWGQFDWLNGQPEQPFVHLHRLAFVNPREVAELMEWRLRP